MTKLSRSPIATRPRTETLLLLFPCAFALTGGLLLHYLMASISASRLHRPVWDRGRDRVVMVIFLDAALDLRLARGSVDQPEIETATIEGAPHCLRPKPESATT